MATQRQPTDIIVDLGSGGLTPGLCTDAVDGCVQVAGEYTADQVADCYWKYIEQWSWCGSYDHVIDVTLETDGTYCWWKVDVLLYLSLPTGAGRAIYETSPTTFTNALCGLSSPITLAKVAGSEDWNGICAGSLPATITIEAAV